MASDKRLARTRPYDIRVARGYSQRANGRNGLVVKEGIPVDAAIGRLENSSGCHAYIVDIGISGNPRHRSRAISYWPDVPELHLVVNVRTDLRRLLRAG